MGVVHGSGESSWGAADVVSRFATSSGYSDAGESAALGSVAEWARGDVLDIGVGGGRTTGLRAPGARSCVALDLSPEMLALARRRHPRTELRLGDAVGLTGLP